MDVSSERVAQATAVSPDGSEKRLTTGTNDQSAPAPMTISVDDQFADCIEDYVAVASKGGGPSPGLVDGKGYFCRRVSSLNDDDETQKRKDKDLRVNEDVQFSDSIEEVADSPPTGQETQGMTTITGPIEGQFDDCPEDMQFTDTSRSRQGKSPMTTTNCPIDGQFDDCPEDVPVSAKDGEPSPKENTPQGEEQVRIEVQPPMDENDVIIGEKQGNATRKKFWRFAQPDMDLLEAEYDATSFCRAILTKWQAQLPKGRFIQKERATGKYRLMKDSESLAYILERLKLEKPESYSSCEKLGPFDAVMGLRREESVRFEGNCRLEGLIDVALKEYRMAKGGFRSRKLVFSTFWKRKRGEFRIFERNGSLVTRVPRYNKIVGWLEKEFTWKYWRVLTEENSNSDVPSSIETCNGPYVVQTNEITHLNSSNTEGEDLEPGETQSVGVNNEVPSEQDKDDARNSTNPSTVKRPSSASTEGDLPRKRCKANETDASREGGVTTDECDDSDQRSVANLQKESGILLGCRDHQRQTNYDKDFIQAQNNFIESLRSENEVLRKESHSQMQQMEGVQNQLDQSTALLNSLSDHSTKIEADNDAKKQLISSLELEMVSKIQEVELIQTKLNRVKHELDQSTEMGVSLNEQIANQRQQLEQVKSMIDELTQQNRSKEVEMEELKLKLSHRSSATEKQNAKLVEVMQSRESLMKLFTDSKSINHSQQVELEQKERTLSRANDEIVQLRRLLLQRDAEISNLSQRSRAYAAKYEQKLEEAQTEFETATANNLSRLEGRERQIEQLKSSLKKANGCPRRNRW